jgi:UDP-N-acetylglucosamine 2-epimerase (non-hydrolysing)
VQLIEPLGYLDFLALQAHADLVLTDSGGVQEETTYLGVPCLTVRPNTERPITIAAGTNRLVEAKQEALLAAAQAALKSDRKRGVVPPLWDGMTAQRIVEAITVYESSFGDD